MRVGVEVEFGSGGDVADSRNRPTHHDQLREASTSLLRSRSSASATLVSGPTAISVISPGFFLTISRMRSTACVLLATRRGPGSAGLPSAPTSAVIPPGHRRHGHGTRGPDRAVAGGPRLAATGGGLARRNTSAPAARCACPGRHPRCRYRRDGFHLQFRGPQGQCQRHGVVNTRIGVDDDPASRLSRRACHTDVGLQSSRRSSGARDTVRP